MTPAVPARRFTPIVSTSRLFELDYPQRVGSYGTYEEAQAAVDFLSDSKFAVANLMIVGTNLKSVERVTGRRTWSSVLIQGAVSGFGTGIVVGLMFYLFMQSENTFLSLILAGLGLGVSFGMLSAALAYALSGGDETSSRCGRWWQPVTRCCVSTRRRPRRASCSPSGPGTG